MGHPRRLAGHSPRAVVLAVLVATVLVATVLVGCSAGDPPDETETPGEESAALRVQTVSGAERIDERTRTELEGAVGDVLSGYVVGAFLSESPRDDFVRSFESFTSGAARDAARDIDALTASGVPEAAAVRATELDARLSFLTRSGEVYGGTAAVHFAFEATLTDGSTQPLQLDGRFLLDAERGTWSIFGYDVALDDGVHVPVETESTP